MGAAYVTVHGMDYLQTQTIQRNPEIWRELNELMPAHPSRAQVNIFFAASTTAHFLIVWAFPRELRNWYQGGSIGAAGYTVIGNKRNGLGWGF